MLERYFNLCNPPVKKIYDCIHGFISLSDFAIRIIDTKFFQRLRDLSQLGTCKYVFPNSNHTRFEHSIGTYHIASKLLEKHTNNLSHEIDNYLSKIPELSRYYKLVYHDKNHPLDFYICELIKIAALCHDLGHGPFSHLFDDVFLPQLNKQNDFCATHEERSGVILKIIIKNDPILSELVHDDEINFMINLISPKSHHNGFIYEIVSNNKTSLDVDKFDYLQRDIHSINFKAKINIDLLVEHNKIIDNTLVYPEQATDDILNLFTTRHRLHVQVYCHKASISVQLMMVEVLLLFDDILGLSSSITDMNKFCDITESYILNSVKLFGNNKNLLNEEQLLKYNSVRQIIDKIESRNIYPMIYHCVSKNKKDTHSYFDNFPDKNSIIIFENKVGYVSGNKPNPLDNILVYKTKDSNNAQKLTAHKKHKKDITLLMPSLYQEYITMIYYKDPTNKQRINELINYCEHIF